MPETVRVLFDHRGPSGRLPRAFAALLAFLVCVTWGSPHGMAQAADGSSGADESHDSAGEELHACTRDADQYQQNSDAPPVHELQAVETDDSEEDAGTEASILCGAVALKPVLPFSAATSRIANADISTQFRVSTALPRGPPHSAR